MGCCCIGLAISTFGLSNGLPYPMYVPGWMGSMGSLSLVKPTFTSEYSLELLAGYTSSLHQFANEGPRATSVTKCGAFLNAPRWKMDVNRKARQNNLTIEVDHATTRLRILPMSTSCGGRDRRVLFSFKWLLLESMVYFELSGPRLLQPISRSGIVPSR